MAFKSRFERIVEETEESKESDDVCCIYDVFMHIRPHEKLIVWQEGHKLCMRVYQVTKKYPSDERFRLVSQLCRSAYSVPMNIAEGNVKRSKKEKARFFEIASGSLEELHYQSVLSRDLYYINANEFAEIDDRIQRVSYLLCQLNKALR